MTPDDRLSQAPERDLVERLRDLSRRGYWPLIGDEAADRIEADAASIAAEQSSRGMFVARLENMQKNGDRWLTIQAVLALLNDCDMLAQRGRDNAEQRRRDAFDTLPDDYECPY